jgi:pimeloyl-ACP methyl ester carboxylesterase
MNSILNLFKKSPFRSSLVSLLLLFLTYAGVMIARQGLDSKLGQRTYSWDHGSFQIEAILWYQTSPFPEQGEPVRHDTVWDLPAVIENASLKEGKSPLIILSHGSGGDCTELAWLAESLVSKNFIVLSVEHPGNCWKRESSPFSEQVKDRPRDIELALDHLFHTEDVRDYIDWEKVGFAGFSMGGLTGLISTLEMDKHQHSPSISALFLMAPRGGAVSVSELEGMNDLPSAAGEKIPESELEKINCPVLIVAGEKDEVLPIHKHCEYLNENIRDCSLHILDGDIGHYVFLNCVSDQGTQILKDKPWLYCDHNSVSRARIHHEVSELCTAFFKTELNVEDGQECRASASKISCHQDPKEIVIGTVTLSHFGL